MITLNKLIEPSSKIDDLQAYLKKHDVDEEYEHPVYKNDSWTLLMIFAYQGRLDMVEVLVEDYKAAIRADAIALRMAAENGHLPVVKYLVQKGANIHARHDYALRFATAEGHLDAVKYLVDRGADIHAENDEALRWAAHNGHQEVVDYLEHVAPLYDLAQEYAKDDREIYRRLIALVEKPALRNAVLLAAQSGLITDAASLRRIVDSVCKASKVTETKKSKVL